MRLNKYQKEAYLNSNLDNAVAWFVTTEKTAYICATFTLRVFELDAVVNSDGLKFQEWIEAKFERLLKAESERVADEAEYETYQSIARQSEGCIY